MGLFPGAHQGPPPCWAPPPRLPPGRSASTWACRSCSPAPTTWPPSATWAPRTSPRGSGWAWSCAAPRGRMTALWGGGATSAVGPGTGCWSGPAASPTGASTGPAWWTKTAKDCGKGLGGHSKQFCLSFYDLLFNAKNIGLSVFNMHYI